MPGLMIIRKGTPVMAALIGVAGTSLLPIASADTLPNGLTVTCSQDSQIHATCIIGGCPRVEGDYVVDALHVMLDYRPGKQEEYDFKCINGETHREGIDVSGPTGFGVQACRKVAVGADKCTPYSHYVYTPPANPAPAPVPPKQALPQQPAPAPAAAPTSATVIGGDANVYNIAHNDVPDPSSGVVGLQIGTLTNGSQVDLDGPCKNGWCRVDSPQIQSGGYGFVEEAHLQFN